MTWYIEYVSNLDDYFIFLSIFSVHKKASNNCFSLLGNKIFKKGKLIDLLFYAVNVNILDNFEAA